MTHCLDPIVSVGILNRRKQNARFRHSIPLQVLDGVFRGEPPEKWASRISLSFPRTTIRRADLVGWNLFMGLCQSANPAPPTVRRETR